jgi:Fe-S oxidoreductase
LLPDTLFQSGAWPRRLLAHIAKNMRCRLTKSGATLAASALAWLGQRAYAERIPAVRVGLMVPCYIDMFYPQIGVATLELLEKLGGEVDYPFDQTCCGQPMANSGAHREAKATEELSIRNFARYNLEGCAHRDREDFHFLHLAQVLNGGAA